MIDPCCIYAYLDKRVAFGDCGEQKAGQFSNGGFQDRGEKHLRIILRVGI